VKQTLVVVAICVAMVETVRLKPDATYPRDATDPRNATDPRDATYPPDATYEVYVASEAADRISLVRLGPDGGRLDHDLGTGVMPTEIDGPHGLAMAPDRRFYYVSLAHGQPFGTVLKYSTADDTVVGRVTLGMFPATMQTTPNGEFLYVVNFNLHGDMVPSSVSVVATAEMLEVARIPTCTMPHGSRINPQGTKHYSACMMDDLLVEIDTATLRASRYFVLTSGAEKGHAGSPSAAASGASTAAHNHDMVGHGLDAPKARATACSPTWAQPSSDGRSVFVACNASNEIVEVDVASWTMTRRFAAGQGVYNLAATKDGRLVATNKRGQSVSVIDARDGRELKLIATRRRVVHGVVVSPDDRYAFVSVEGVGAEPGTVEMIDLRTLTTVATVDVAPQAGGIDFYRMNR
jgi:DNA-binding beta-propeller fold protein YncE